MSFVELVAPVVFGDPSAGHLRPVFHWSVPVGAASFEWRIDAEPWTRGSATTTRWQPTSDLQPGPHVFEVMAFGADGQSTPAASFTTMIELFPAQGFFAATTRTLAKSARGRVCAVSAHNSYIDGYETGELNQAATQVRVDEAIAAGADLIEFDVKEHDGLRISHYDYDAHGALLANVLDYPPLRAADVLLFIELKEVTPTAEMAAQLLDALLARRDVYARNGRPVVLRAFSSVRANLDLLTAAIQDPKYDFIRPYVKFSQLLELDETHDIHAVEDQIIDAAARGLDMIELSISEREFLPKVLFARELGLGVNAYTVWGDGPFGKVVALREEVDVITTDNDPAQMRAMIEEPGGLFYVNPWDQAPGAAVSFERRPGQHHEISVGGGGAPSFAADAATEHLREGRLVFDGNADQSAVLADSQTGLTGDLAVVLVARFDASSMAAGARMPILAGGDPAGASWTLEIIAPPEGGAGAPTFTMRNGTSTASASLPAAALDPFFAQIFIATWEAGQLHLSVDFRADGQQTGSLDGGDPDAVPIVLGTDNGADHFTGSVLMSTATIYEHP